MLSAGSEICSLRSVIAVLQAWPWIKLGFVLLLCLAKIGKYFIVAPGSQMALETILAATTGGMPNPKKRCIPY